MRRFRFRTATAVLLLSALIAGIGPATRPAGDSTTNPLTPRQQDLLLQLADAEANIQAINKSLKATGYSVGSAYDRIDSSRKGNEIMDRNGGGPVRWDDFYGRTAREFARQGLWDDQMDDHRPQQFDFVYKANNDQIARAKEQISSLLKNQRALLDRRQKHEQDQSRLWATLAWEQVKDREIEFRPLYRYALKPAGPEATLLRPLILFLRTTSAVTDDSLDSLQAKPAEQAAIFRNDSRRMSAAYAALQQSMADALGAPDIKPDRTKQALALKAICKQLAEQARVISDDLSNALDRDKANEDDSKLEFRGQLQKSFSSMAGDVARLDDELTATAAAWGITADRTTPNPDVPETKPAPTTGSTSNASKPDAPAGQIAATAQKPSTAQTQPAEQDSVTGMSKADVLSMLNTDRTWYWTWDHQDKANPLKFSVDANGTITSTLYPDKTGTVEKRWVVIHGGHCLVPLDWQTLGGIHVETGRHVGVFTESKLADAADWPADGPDRAALLHLLSADRTWYWYWDKQKNKKLPVSFRFNGDVPGTVGNDKRKPDTLEQRWLVFYAGHCLIPIDQKKMSGFFIQTGRQAGAFTDETP